MSEDPEQLEINGIPMGPELTKEQATQIYEMGQDVVVFVLMTQAKMAAENPDDQKQNPGGPDDPSCPSAQKPTYKKPEPKKRKSKAGQKKGHEGTRRSKPATIDRTEHLRAKTRPICGEQLTQCNGMRHRYVEDIPEGIKVEVCKTLKRLIRDGIRLRKAFDTLDSETYERRYHRLEERLQALAYGDWDNPEANRLANRLKRHQNEIFTFVLEPEVPTGSNMAGKTTFIRILGLNALLAQTLYTCMAESYQASLLRIISSINEKDDLVAGKSYYLVEAEQLLRMVKLSEEDQILLCLVDEPLGGTNSNERLAASLSITRYMANQGALVAITTHDLQLARKLNDVFDCYHFSDNVDHRGMHFDYQLRQGIASSSNAIKLLEYLEYPEEITVNAQLIEKG